MTEFEVAKKKLKEDMLLLAILELIFLFLTLASNKFNFFCIIYAVVLFLGYTYAKKGKRAAGIIGVIIGVLMMISIISSDIIDFLLGLFVLLHSLKYLKLMNKNYL